IVSKYTWSVDNPIIRETTFAVGILKKPNHINLCRIDVRVIQDVHIRHLLDGKQEIYSTRTHELIKVDYLEYVGRMHDLDRFRNLDTRTILFLDYDLLDTPSSY